MHERKANAEWKGNLKDGRGTVSSGSGALRDVAYEFRSRFESGTNTNPEELIGAALAACYSMALAHDLAEAGHPAESVRTEAKVSFEKQDAGWTITRITLDVTGRVPGVSADVFQQAAEKTRTGCPVARSLRADIQVNARLA